MSTRRARVPATGKSRTRADGKAARQTRSPANGKADGADGRLHAKGRLAGLEGKLNGRPATDGKSPALGRGATVDGKLPSISRPTEIDGNGEAASNGRPTSGNGLSFVRSSLSLWRVSRERQHDREVKREAVIRAAAHAFNLKGYHNTSLDDIAAALEVTKPTVYYYVTNKEQLLFECIVAGVEQIRAAFREEKQLLVPARERLKAVLHQKSEAVASEFGWCMVRAEEQD